jgi:hypothetical protein
MKRGESPRPADRDGHIRGRDRRRRGAVLASTVAEAQS